MNIKLSEFLKDTEAEIPESLSGGDVFKLTYTEKMDGISIFARFPSVVPTEDVFKFEKKGVPFTW